VAQPLRILFWNELYLPAIGGAEIFTARLARGLQERGHSVAVVADQLPHSLPPRETIDQIPVYRFPFRAALRALSDPAAAGEAQFEFMKISKAVRALKSEGMFDIVHVNFSGPGPLFHLRTRQQDRSGMVVTLQTALTAKAGGEAGLARDLLRAADRVVAVSQPAAKNIELCAGYPLDKISVIYPGIPGDLFAPSTPRPGLPTIVFIGRLVTDKGADCAIRAMQPLRGRARLVVIGDGPEKAALENLAAELSLTESVHFTGYISDDERRKFLAEATAMLVPSRHEELFGMVAAEGSLSSLPVVVSDTGGLPEVVQDGVTGIVVPKDEPQALSQALQKLLSNPALAKEMGKAGRERVRKKFLLEKTVDDYENLYAEIKKARS